MGSFRHYIDALVNDGEDIVEDYVLSSFAVDLLEGRLDKLNPAVQEDLNEVIIISNLLYNYTDRSILPLEDGIYDMLMVMASNLGMTYAVGAMPVPIQVTQTKVPLKPAFIKDDELIDPFVKLDENRISKGLYTTDLIYPINYTRDQLLRKGLINMEQMKKKTLNIPHEYPKLVGTLDKAKFVLNSQADELGLLNEDNISIFERDFLKKQLDAGLFGPNDHIRLLATLKMDGVSVEATVSDRVLSARSRGDTNNDIATDLTPALKGYRFPKAEGQVKDDQAFGMKFECMLSNHALGELGRLREVDYANPRNAIIGLLGAGDCNQWIDYITLVPLETSLDINPLEEIVFMNELYAMEPLRYAVIEGSYTEVLFQVKQFVEEAEYLRPIMPYIYDGVVITHIDDNIRKALGRVNSINKYQIAIKFQPMKKYTTFLGYTFSIGQNGIVTPLAHYNPVELFGAIHAKTTAHSKARFEELGLREGDIVTIELINDVIPYISKADVDQNNHNTNPIIPFPEYCPECNTKLIVSESGKSVLCPNRDCPGRRLSLTSNMLAKLGFKDFGEKTLMMVPSIRSLKSLIHVNPADLDVLGPTEKQNFLTRIDELLYSKMWDYRLVGALGFSNISAGRWATILRHIPFGIFICVDDEQLRADLSTIKGIGKVIIDTIIEERPLFLEDLLTIEEEIPYKMSFSRDTLNTVHVRFSGVRDDRLLDYLDDLGYDATYGAVTKKTDILIVPDINYQSSKTKAVPDTCKIIPIHDFIATLQDYPEV